MSSFSDAEIEPALLLHSARCGPASALRPASGEETPGPGHCGICGPGAGLPRGMEPTRAPEVPATAPEIAGPIRDRAGVLAQVQPPHGDRTRLGDGHQVRLSRREQP